MSSPTPLPMTRKEALRRMDVALKILAVDDLDEHEGDAIAAAWGLTFAPEPPAPPERKWPAKLEAETEGESADVQVRDQNGEYVAAICSGRFGIPGFRDEAIRRWNRCEELEQEIRDGWRPADQQNQEALERQRLRIDGLLGELAERTRERDEWRVAAREARERVGIALSASISAEVERDELRWRCEAAEAERDRLAGWMIQIDGGDNPCRDEGQLRQWAYEALTLHRPVPGQEPTDA